MNTGVRLGMTCTQQSGAEQKLMPRIEKQKPAFFERSFPAQARNAALGSGLERRFSSLWGGSSCTQ